MKHRLQNLLGRLRYKEIAMQPYTKLAIIAALLFSLSVNLIDNFLLAIAFVFLYIVSLQIIVSSYSANTVQINDFLIVRRHPFKKSLYYIYQKINGQNLNKYNCNQLRELYFFEMPKVLGYLKPGTYRTVTQSFFAKEILKDKNILVTTNKKAYKKRINQLQKEIFMNRCRDCKKTDCAYKASKVQKQFYYLEFTVMEG